MKILLVLFLMTSFGYAQVKTPVKATALKSKGGGGGDKNKSAEAGVINTLQSVLLKLEAFFKKHPEAQKEFPELNVELFSETILDIVNNNKIVLVRDCDARNDHNLDLKRSKCEARLRDRHGIVRTVINYPEETIQQLSDGTEITYSANTLEFDYEETLTLLNNSYELMTLLPHEIFMLLGLEDNHPNQKGDHDAYTKSASFGKYVSPISSYDYIFNPENQTEINYMERLLTKVPNNSSIELSKEVYIQANQNSVKLTSTSDSAWDCKLALNKMDVDVIVSPQKYSIGKVTKKIDSVSEEYETTCPSYNSWAADDVPCMQTRYTTFYQLWVPITGSNILDTIYCSFSKKGIHGDGVLKVKSLLSQINSHFINLKFSTPQRVQ